MTDKSRNIKGKGLPEVKRQQVGPMTKKFIRFTNSQGKKMKLKTKSYSEAEIPDIHLIKIAPMFYFSLDSNKVLMIPFTIKFSAEEFLKQTGAQAVNFKELMDTIGMIDKIDSGDTQKE
jgi:hypothetical protein